MISEIVTVVLIALATHRITRFLVRDHLSEVPRLRAQLWFEQRWEKRTGMSSDKTWGSKVAYLLGCSWCTGLYVAAGVTAGAAIFTTVPLPILTALAASSVTGALSQLSHDELA